MVYATYFYLNIIVTSLLGVDFVLAYDTVPLQEHVNYCSQLATVHNMVWKNMGTINMAVASSV